MVNYVSISGAIVRVPASGLPTLTPSREEYTRYQDAILEILQQEPKEPYTMKKVIRCMHSRRFTDDTIIRDSVCNLIGRRYLGITRDWELQAYSEPKRPAPVDIL